MNRKISVLFPEAADSYLLSIIPNIIAPTRRIFDTHDSPFIRKSSKSQLHTVCSMLSAIYIFEEAVLESDVAYATAIVQNNQQFYMRLADAIAMFY